MMSYHRALTLALLAGFIAARPVYAQVKTDIRTDGTLGATTTLSGPNVRIPASLGRRAGNNLFHSFDRFSIGTGDSATFTGPADVKNVLSRVTGGKPSSIDGTLRSTMAGADFWFINPAGVAFGPNASLDVPASFHVSTADELRFPGGEVFSATDPAKSVLSVAAPEAFGFLSAKPAPISLDVGAGKAFGISSSEGKTLSFTGGDITITGDPGSAILTLGGEIDFVSLASPGEVRLSGMVATDSALGTVRIKGSPPHDNNTVPFLVSSSGPGGGAIRIRGGEVVASDVAFGALNFGVLNATGGIFIKADDIDLGGANYIFTGSASNKLPGKADIEARNLRISGTGGIGTFAPAGTTSRSGDVTITADTAEIDGARISADTSSAGQGGNITVTGRTLRLTNGGGITSTANGSGAGGQIVVGPFDEIVMSNRGVISAETFGGGDAGAVKVEASRVSVNNSFIGANTGGANTGGAGNAGPVKVTVTDQLTFTNEGRIFNGTSGSGNGGNITVDVRTGALVADKQPIDHPHVNHTGISASPQAGSSGNGGNVIISAGTIILRNGAQITTDTKGTGNAGLIDITMGSTLRLEADGLIGTCSGAGPDCKDRTNSFGTTGDAGAIIVRGGDKIILDHGRITSFARSDKAEGGRITLQANDLIYLKDSEVSSEVFGDRGTTAGNIEITTPLLVQNDSQVLARATEGTGGKIQIIANSLVVSQDSAIDASSQRGIDGTVVFSTPEADVTSSLVVLPAEFVDAASRLRDSCAVRSAAETSRFARAGRVLPPGPEHPQMVSYAPAAASEDIAEATDLLWTGGAPIIACGTQP